MKNDLVIVKTTPVKIEFDFEAAEAYLKSELEKYDVVVTLETLPGGKELAKELNKTAGEIDATRKEKIADVSGPIKDFDYKMKTLVAMCKDGRANILSQIKVFEDETRITITGLLSDYLFAQWDALEVKEEFRTSTYDGLVILSSMTKAGSLAGKAKSEIDKRVNADIQKQNMVEKRLLLLENASYKAGLSAPLTRVHVNAFLFEDDESYNQKLDEIIASEKQRQEVTEEAVRKRTLKESKQDEPAPTIAEEPTVEAKAEPETVTTPTAPEGKVVHVLTARFEVETPESVTSDRVVSALEKKLKEAGITTLKEIKVIV